MRPLLCFCVFVLVLGCGPAWADRADDYVEGEMQQRRIPGLALTVVQDGKAVKTKCYGYSNLELCTPVLPETVFEIGSVTKQFTAAGILLLEQDGKLSVDDKLSRHLEKLPSSWTNVTLRHLLTHTSGIRNYTGLDGFELRRRLTQTKFLETIAPQAMDFAPGESFKYCNTGYSLLGYVIENVSRTNYWEFMRERIFRPLGMTNTVDRFPGALVPNRASGYEQTNHVWINRDYDLTDVFSAGAIASTVIDLARWNAALDCEAVLSFASKSKAWTAARLNSGKETKYGFGWYVDAYEGHKNIGHSGSTSGFSAALQRFPNDGLAVILLTNTDEAVAAAMAKKIATFYFRQPTASR